MSYHRHYWLCSVYGHTYIRMCIRVLVILMLQPGCLRGLNCVYVCSVIFRVAFIVKFCTIETPYCGLFLPLINVLITEVSSLQRLLDIITCYTGTQNGVLITDVSTVQSFSIDRVTLQIRMYVNTYVPICMLYGTTLGYRLDQGTTLCSLLCWSVCFVCLFV